MIKLNDVHPQFIMDENGRKTSVILPIDAYEALIEDLEDLAVVAERRDEPTLAHDKLMEELKANGLLPD